ncbi:MAG TPA: hypothetical protein VH306_03755 [Gaiellaceae bacterium]
MSTKAANARLEEALDELYAVEPEQFTARRNELRKELKDTVGAEAAEEVGRRRRPPVAAWALNRLARTQRDDVRRFVRDAERVRGLQEALLGGTRPKDLDKAVADLRRQLGELSKAATGIAAEAGHSATAVSDRIFETLFAAAADEGQSAELLAGRLEKESKPAGFGFGPGAAVSPGRARTKSGREAGSSAAARKKEQAKRRVAEAGEKVKEAKREAAEAEREVRRLEGELRSASRGAERAAARLADAEAKLKRAKKS